MGFQFADQRKWTRKGLAGFSTSIVGFILVIVQVYLVESINSFIFISSFIPVVVGLFQGIHYINITQHDYVFLEESCLSIYRGPLFPRKQFANNEINYCVEMSGLLIFYLDDNKEAQLNTDWLSHESIVAIKEQLQKRVEVENLFRAGAEPYTLYSKH